MVKHQDLSKMTMMRTSRKLIEFLKNKALYGETLEQVVWRLINGGTKNGK